jgi:hypothetical protein
VVTHVPRRVVIGMHPILKTNTLVIGKE